MGLLEGLEVKDGIVVGRTAGGDDGVVVGTTRSRGPLEGLEVKDGEVVGRTTGGDNEALVGTAGSTGIVVGAPPTGTNEGNPCATGWADGRGPAYPEGLEQVGGC